MPTSTSRVAIQRYELAICETIDGEIHFDLSGQFTKPLDEPFKMMWWAREYIFLPPKYLQDLKSADSASLSFFDNLSTVSELYQYDWPWHDFRNRHLVLITPLVIFIDPTS